MSEDQFTTKMRDFTRRKPFIPFEVKLNNGGSIVIDQPTMVFGAGVAGFVSDTEGLVDFSCDEVRDIAFVTAETSL